MNWYFVAKLENETAKGVLVPAGGGMGFEAISGPWGNGPMPPGRYFIGTPFEIHPDNKPYRDASGFAWFATLRPQFTTKRKGLGIHPDGNVPGTLGCLGLLQPDTRSAFAALQRGSVLTVVYEP